MSRVAVVGWYGHGNVGDEAYKEAFEHILPGRRLTFLDHWPEYGRKFTHIIIGGGSFLDQPIPGFNDLVSNDDTPLAFVSVGVHGEIHPVWETAIKRAKTIVVRDTASRLRLKMSFNRDCKVLPDLVLALDKPPKKVPRYGDRKKLLFIPNYYTMPRKSSDSYVAASWAWFTNQASEILDGLSCIYDIRFASMCTNSTEDDRFAAAGIASLMQEKREMSFDSANQQRFEAEILDADIVVTQRFHGDIFARVYSKPCVQISHHDKIYRAVEYMDENADTVVPYYGFSKDGFYKALRTANSRYLDYSSLREGALSTRSILEKEFFV